MNQIRKAPVTLLLSLAIVAFTVSCGKSRNSSIGAAGDAPASYTVTLSGEAQRAWDNRSEEDDLRKAIPLMEKQLESDPNNYALNVMLSRAYYMLADVHLWLKIKDLTDVDASIKAAKLDAYDKSVQYAERALGANKAFADAVKNGASAEASLGLLTKKEVDAIFFRYAALARWSRLQGTMTLLANRGKFKEMMARVEALDPGYFQGSVLRYKGGAEALSPGGSKTKAKEFFDAVVKQYPNYAGNFVLYADVFAKQKANDRALFDSLLKKALAVNPNSVPEYKQENIGEQKKAKKFLDVADDLF